MNYDSDAEPRIFAITAIFLVFYFLAATQDIAVDGWAVTMLSEANTGYASTCNAVGQTVGYILAYSGFLWLKLQYDLTLVTFTYYLGIGFIITTIAIALFIKEKPFKAETEQLNMIQTYQIGLKISKNINIRSIVALILGYKISMASFETITTRKLLKNGLKKEVVSSITFFITPVTLILPGILSKYTSETPLLIVKNSFIPRLVLNILGCSFVLLSLSFDLDFNSLPVYTVLLALSLALAAIQQIVFTATMSFYAKIADESIGGTYMTFLNTLNNLSSLLPNQMVLYFVGKLSIGGVDGYFLLCLASALFGLGWYSLYKTSWITYDKLPRTAWSVVKKKK